MDLSGLQDYYNATHGPQTAKEIELERQFKEAASRPINNMTQQEQFAQSMSNINNLHANGNVGFSEAAGMAGDIGNMGGGGIVDTLKSYGLGFDMFSSIPISPTEQGYDAINYKVRLVSVLGLKNAFQTNDINSVVFDVTPTFNESGGVNYNPVQPIHLPGSIQTYKSTDSRTFTIGATLISRSTGDVIKNMRYLQTLRSWRYPFFGKSTGNSSAANRIKNSGSGSANLLGAPPEILFLYAYSTSNNDFRQFDNEYMRVNINRVPVVLSSLNIEYPQDVDYLPSSLTPNGKTEPFPVKMSVNITLLEAHSPFEYEDKFDLMAYKNGTMTNI